MSQALRPDPVGIDPRIEKRRVEVARGKRRGRRMLLVAVVTVPALFVLAFVVLRSPLFAVGAVRVLGPVHGPRSSVVAASGVHRGALMVGVDPGAASRAVESLPWVKAATVERQWPSTVVVHVEERVPAAQVPAPGGNWSLVDGTGRVLSTGPPRQGLLALGGTGPTGPPGSRLGHAGRLALDVARRIPAYVRSYVGAVTVNGGEVDLSVAPGGETARLGTATDLPEKFEALLTVEDRVDLTGIAVIDLRVPQDPALTPR